MNDCVVKPMSGINRDQYVSDSSNGSRDRLNGVFSAARNLAKGGAKRRRWRFKTLDETTGRGKCAFPAIKAGSLAFRII
jgi:hypothetical protein